MIKYDLNESQTQRAESLSADFSVQLEVIGWVIDL